MKSGIRLVEFLVPLWCGQWCCEWRVEKIGTFRHPYSEAHDIFDIAYLSDTMPRVIFWRKGNIIGIVLVPKPCPGSLLAQFFNHCKYHLS